MKNGAKPYFRRVMRVHFEVIWRLHGQHGNMNLLIFGVALLVRVLLGIHGHSGKNLLQGDVQNVSFT